nr:MAG TPA: hypothetical protein [Caudoviricetes sp.]
MVKISASEIKKRCSPCFTVLNAILLHTLAQAAIFLTRQKSAIISARTLTAVAHLSPLRLSSALSCHRVKWCQRHRIRQRQDSNRSTGCDQIKAPQMRGFFR